MNSGLKSKEGKVSVLGQAVFSDCRKYRYWLERVLNTNHKKTRAILFIGLNPSIASEHINDRTINRCIGFAKNWGFTHLWMANLFAIVSTDPLALKSTTLDPVGRDNDYWIKTLSKKAEVTVVAWGDHGTFQGRDKIVLSMISNPMCLSKNKTGNPKHPLYVRKEQNLFPFKEV